MTPAGDLLVYAMTAALAVSAGLTLGSSTHRLMTYVAGLLITGVAVGLAFWSDAAWVGPLFALVSLTTGTLTAAAEKGKNPSYAEASLASRVLAVLNVRRGVPLDEPRVGAATARE